MKKILFALVAFFAAVNVASAKSGVTVTSGSLTDLNQDGTTIYVVYKYDKETLDGKSAADFIAAKPDKRSAAKLKDEREDAEGCFLEAFNVLSKTAKVVESKAKAKYVLTIDFQNFQYGSAAAALIVGFGAGKAHMTGTATITKDGQTVATLDFQKITADGDDSKKDIRGWAYINLAQKISKAISKSK